jgi:hypothetical protein
MLNAVLLSTTLQQVRISITECHNLCLWTEPQSRQMHITTDTADANHTDANF